MIQNISIKLNKLYFISVANKKTFPLNILFFFKWKMTRALANGGGISTGKPPKLNIQTNCLIFRLM
jgi:hypothetical protein